MSEDSNVTNTILSLYKSFSSAEQRVADFILERKGSVSSLNASEIAHGARTSSTTVTRFVKRIGFESFSELRLALAREEAKKEGPFDGSSGIRLDDLRGSVQYILQNRVEEITDTAKQLDLDALGAAVDLLRRAHSVMVVGVGTSLCFAEMFAFELSHVGVRAVCPGSSDAATVLSQLSGPDDCVVFTSNSGRSRRLNTIMDNAIDASVPTIAITSDAESSLARRADISITAVNRDHLLANGFDFSHSAMNFIGDVIVMLLWHSMDDSHTYLQIYEKSFAHDKDVPAHNEAVDADENEPAR